MRVTIRPKPISLFSNDEAINNRWRQSRQRRSVLDLTWPCGVNDFVAFKLSFGFFPRHVQLGGAQDFGAKPSW